MKELYKIRYRRHKCYGMNHTDSVDIVSQYIVNVFEVKYYFLHLITFYTYLFTWARNHPKLLYLMA